MKDCKKISLFICAMLIVATSMVAQTYQQRGVVRMITTSASSPITPVAGVKVAIGNNVSKATGSNGAFTMSVTKQFNVNDVKPSDTYVLALPTKGKTYYHSQNDLDVVVTTKAQKEADYKKLYAQIKAKYDAQSDELMALKRKYQRKISEMKETDAEYVKVKKELDSIQALYLDYINNEQKIDEEIKRIAEETSITDYQTLNETEQKVYELRCEGEWKAINDLLRHVMHGDRAGFLQEGKDLVAQKEQELKEAQLGREARFRLMEQDIESFMMRHINDSVSMCYKILTDAAPDNWDYLIYAGMFEESYIANYSKALDYFNRAVATNPVDTLLAAGYNNIGCVYFSQGDYAKALELYEKALETVLLVRDEDNLEVARIYNNIGDVYFFQGDNAKALEQYEKALKIRLSVLGENNHIEIATSYGNIGSVYGDLGNYANALELHEKALKIRLTVYGENHPDVATSYNKIGWVYTNKGEYAKALEQYEKALKIELSVFGENHPDVAMSYNNIGSIYDFQGNYSKALEQYEKALKIKLSVFGENHPDVAMSYNNIGMVYSSQGNYSKALEQYEKVLKIRLSVFGENHPDVATIYNNIGFVYSSQGDYDMALEHYEKVLKILLSVYGESHPYVATSYSNIGGVYYSQGNNSKALEYFDKGLKILLSVFGENHPYVATSYNNIGGVYYSQGDYTNALGQYEKALKILLLVFGENHPNVATSYNNIGMVYSSQGNYAKALEYFDKGLKMFLSVFGENHPDVATIRNLIYDCSYKYAIEEHDAKRLGKLIVKVTIVNGDVASQHGLDGEYYICELDDWTIETIDRSVFDVNVSLRGKPKDVVLYKDGKITKEHFEDTIGMQFSISAIEPADKARIVEEYRKWKSR